MLARFLACSALAVACSAPSGPSPRAPGAAPTAWQRHADPDGRFELQLPPGAALSELTPGSGDRYLTWTPTGSRSTFSVLVTTPARDTLTPLLTAERRAESFELELDEELDWQGHGARHVRARVERDEPRSWQRDPASGRRFETGPRRMLGVIDFLALSGSSASVRVGFRYDSADAPELQTTLSLVVESFRPGPNL